MNVQTTVFYTATGVPIELSWLFSRFSSCVLVPDCSSFAVLLYEPYWLVCGIEYCCVFTATSNGIDTVWWFHFIFETSLPPLIGTSLWEPSIGMNAGEGKERRTSYMSVAADTKSARPRYNRCAEIPITTTVRGWNIYVAQRHKSFPCVPTNKYVRHWTDLLFCHTESSSASSWHWEENDNTIQVQKDEYLWRYLVMSEIESCEKKYLRLAGRPRRW